MANVLIDETVLQGWANTVREKTGATDKMKPSVLLEQTQANWGSGGGGGDDTSFKDIIEGTAVNPVLPAGLTKIGDYAFYQNTNLKQPSIPDSVTTIGKYAFRYCSNLALTSLPNGVNDIGEYAFVDCSNLALTSLPDGLKTVRQNTFYRCTNLAVTSFPAGLTTIEGHAFNGCQITFTHLPDGLTTIGDYAFCRNKCSTIYFPASITNIGNLAFGWSDMLTTVTFFGKPSTIQSSIFSNCDKLATINVPWAEGEVANAPWGATKATINYNYTGE